MTKYILKNKFIIFLVLFFTILRLIISYRFELGTDEAHYVLYGRHLALSYFDHPPLVGWIHNIFIDLKFLPIQVAARIPALLCSTLSNLLINTWLERKNYSLQSRLLGLLGLNVAILFSALSFFFLPDTLFLVLVPLLSLTTENLMRNKSFLNWTIFGITLGLCGITKYTAILFLIPIIWYWFKNKRLTDLLTFQFWMAVFIAVLFVSPVLLWNLKHDFISFKYQSGHIISFQSLNFSSFLLAQFSLFILLGFFYMFCFPKPKNLHDRFDFYLFLTPLIFFSFFALFENFLPHWVAPFFVLALPWGLAESYSSHLGLTKWLKSSMTAAIILFVIIHSELAFQFLPFSASKDLYRDIQGWQNFTERSLLKSNYPLAVTNWTFGSRVKLYSEIAGQNSLTVLDHRIDQFDLWSEDFPVPANYLILVEMKNEVQFLNSIQCDQQKNLGIDGPQFKNKILVDFTLVECTGFHWKNL
ncbi:MAG: glycosyltransferase family 39 protein [Pseudobdellovibrio sp.]